MLNVEHTPFVTEIPANATLRPTWGGSSFARRVMAGLVDRRPTLPRLPPQFWGGARQCPRPAV